jgi:gluconolactonase
MSGDAPALYEMFDDRFRTGRCMNGDDRLEVLYTGCRWAEGPIYVPAWRQVIWSDIPNDRMLRWDEETGAVSVFRRDAGYTNGNTLDRQGRLITCEQGNRRVTRTEHDGTVTVLADHWQGKRLNSPNDVVVRSDGTIYFTDPTYGRMPVFGVERPQELEFQGVYRIAPGRGLHCEANDFSQPNGLCLSPDETTLYVNDTTRALIRAFDVAPDGALSHDRVFAQGIGTGDYEEGVVDGMKCDEHGNVYVTGPRGIWVFGAQGTHLGVLRMPEIAGNLNWGGPDWRDLYCCCSTSIYRVRMNVRGSPVAYMRMA